MVFCKLIFHCSIGSCVIVWWLTVLVWCIGIGLWSAKRTYSFSGPFTDPFRAKKLMQGARLICSCQSSSKKSIHFRLLLAFHNGLIKTALMLRVTRMLWAPLIIMSLGRGCWAWLSLLLAISGVSGSGYLDTQPGHDFRHVSDALARL